MAAKKKVSLLKRVGIGIAVLVVALAVVVAGYFGVYYHADNNALSGENDKGVALAVSDESDWATFAPEGQTDFERGLVLYPGAKVQAEAYGPMAADLAARGWFVAIAKMPLNFAMFGKGAADDVIATYPQVKSWYAGGHSLGGVVSAMYAEDNADKLAGLVFLASYSSVDLTGTNLDVISVYGSEDTVLSLDKYEEARENLPVIAEHVIAGGNHAQFGSYGEQKGDGEATINAEQQRTEAADYITEAAGAK